MFSALLLVAPCILGSATPLPTAVFSMTLDLYPVTQLQITPVVAQLPSLSLAHAPDAAETSWLIGGATGVVLGGFVGYAVGRRSGPVWGMVAGTLSTAVVAVVVTLMSYVVFEG